MILELIRLEDNADHGTFGVLLMDKELFCLTLEPKEWQNKLNVSCIPANKQYTIQPYHSPKFGDVYIVEGVPGRDDILFHPGNIVNHTHGCILLGSTIGKLRGDRAVLNSGATFKEFMSRMGGTSGLLTVKTCF